MDYNQYQEFGRAFEVSADVPDDMVDITLKNDFERAKKEYFPTWEDSTYKKIDGPPAIHQSIVRKDGQPVDDEVHEKWMEYYFWDEDESTPRPDFDYGDEYTLETYVNAVVGWHALVPKEYVINANV